MVGPASQNAWNWVNNTLTAETWSNETIPRILGYIYNQTGRVGKTVYDGTNSIVQTIDSDLRSTSPYNSLSVAGTLYYNGPDASTADILASIASSFIGLSANIDKRLTGSSFGSPDSIAFNVTNFDEDLNRKDTTAPITNLLSALQLINSNLELPLKQLQAVLANDDDLLLRQQTKDEVDAITDNFTGDKPSAPSVGDIEDMAGISGDLSGMLDSGVGVGELVGVVNGADTYSFFSQRSADALDTTGATSAAADHEDDLYDLSGYVENELGILVPAGDMFQSVEDFLTGGE